MEKIFVQMKTAKILKVGEYAAVRENLTKDTRIYEVKNEKVEITSTEPLYESSMSVTKKIENAVIALPEGEISLESLTDTISRFLNDQQIKGDHGFSVGNYFAGDYKSGENKWNEKSLCVSLWGDISDRAGTIATAVQILSAYHLPRILVMNETSVLEITKDGNEVKPLPQNRIKRIGD